MKLKHKTWTISYEELADKLYLTGKVVGVKTNDPNGSIDVEVVTDEDSVTTEQLLIEVDELNKELDLFFIRWDRGE